jgi:hypothetical protein
VVLSFQAVNYTKWAIYISGVLGHVNGTIAAA